MKGDEYPVTPEDNKKSRLISRRGWWFIGRADALSRHWTAKQAEALTLALAPGAPSQSEMAAKLGITQQAFAIRLNGAGLWGLDESLRLFEARSYA